MERKQMLTDMQVWIECLRLRGWTIQSIADACGCSRSPIDDMHAGVAIDLRDPIAMRLRAVWEAHRE